jgi:hypothetical protein
VRRGIGDLGVGDAGKMVRGMHKSKEGMKIGVYAVLITYFMVKTKIK